MTNTQAIDVVDSEPADNISHNSVLEQSVSDLQAIEAMVEESETHLKNHLLSVRKALVAVFKLGLVLQENNLVKIFHDKQGLDFPKKSERNLFHGLVSRAFQRSPREDAKSKYRQILLYAQLKRYSADELAKLLEKSGIEAMYKDARDYLKDGFASLYEETNTERFDRARNEFKSTKIGSVIKLAKHEDVPKNFGGYTNAVLRVTGRQIEVVALHRQQTQDEVEASVAALIDPEGSRVRAKLKAKSLYPLFTLADVFSQFVLNKSDVETMEKAVRQQSLGPFEVPDGDLDQVDTIKRLIKRTKEPLKKFERLSALVFSNDNSEWTAETRSTLPSFPVVRFEFGKDSQRISVRPQLGISDNQAEGFRQWFLEPVDWKLVRNGGGFAAKSTEGRFVDVAPWQPTSHSWRRLKQFDDIGTQFDVSKLDLREILGWKDNRPAQHGRKPSFPKFMTLRNDGDEVFLQIGNETAQRKRLGVLAKASKESKPIDDLTLAVQYINEVARLSADYDLSFKVAIRHENGAPMALQFTSIDFWCPLTVTLPLTISNYGAPTEICQFI